jgi:hypothetical protein
MRRRLKHVAVVFITVFATAQLVRPERTNPATDASRTIQAHGRPSELVANHDAYQLELLDISCPDSLVPLPVGWVSYAALGRTWRDL